MINILATVLLALVTLMAFVFVTLTVIAFVKGFIKGVSKKNMYLVRAVTTDKSEDGDTIAHRTDIKAYIEAESLKEAVDKVIYQNEDVKVFPIDDEMFW